MITIEQEIENYKQAKAIAEKLRIWETRTKDVHTEHCCIDCKHCKYLDKDCSVLTGKLLQSYPCEDCRKREQQEEFFNKIVRATFKIANLEATGGKELDLLRKEFMEKYSLMLDDDIR